MQNDQAKQVGDEPVMTETAKEEERLKQEAQLLGVKYLEAGESVTVSQDILNIVSEDVARRYGMAAFGKENGVVKLAMKDPQNFEALNVLRFIAGNTQLEFEIYLVDQETLENILEQYAGGADQVIEDAMKSLQDGEELEDIFDDRKSEEKPKEEVLQEAPVTKLLSVVIRHAIEGKASDIHIEPVEKSCRVRFRVDGVLHSSLTVPKEVGRAIVSRIKILSNLKIDEKRKPQDGRFKVSEGGRRIDFRVSTLPVVDGEKVVLRILDKDNKKINIQELGLVGSASEIIMRHLRDPFGIILITGPTGSGKSTTLYGFLQILNQEERNIITLEDPVEYSIEGINQSQIQPEIGYTFSSGLRSILRQDPNVIMVGEIRDDETAELSIHAALTGHLVFSTLHTNSSIGAIPRLIDMGVEPFLLSSSLQVVAAQRLVRRICGKCKEEEVVPHALVEMVKRELESVDREEFAKMGVDLAGGYKFYHGKGCEECSQTGYKGRVAVFEALEIDDELKEIISESSGSKVEIEKYAQKRKMVMLKQDGLIKALKGLTTLAEVERVTEGSLSVGGDVDDDKG